MTLDFKNKGPSNKLRGLINVFTLCLRD